MLRRLFISNYLLIDRLELELDKGFTTITGETGSGKSIVIGALGLALGDRAEGDTPRDPKQRCIVEVEIDTKGLDVEGWLDANGVPHERFMMLRRQLEPGGRSRSFINDTPVRLDQLRELGERLVHVHSQHQTLLLNDPAFQLGLIDHAAGLSRELEGYIDQYTTWQRHRFELERVREEEARSSSELDYLRFQLDELEAAQLKGDEQPVIERELAKAEHAGEIARVLQATEDGLAGDEGALGILSAVRVQLGRITDIDADAARLAERLESLRLELKDVSQEATRMAQGVSVDPAEAERLRERLDLLLRLEHKHRVKDEDGLIALRDELRSRTGRIGSLGDRIAALELEEQRSRAEVLTLASTLSARRSEAIGPLTTQVSALLQELGMPRAVFRFEHATTEPGPRGIDRVRAMFSANVDRSPAPLSDAASGGELSRVMLALISLAAESRDLSTVIFDEIDSGVSGEVAHRVGSLLARMARDRQVIAITHLPQIASRAGVHLQVSKEQEAEAVVTSIRPVDGEARVQVLAQMLSGKRTGKAAVENARELLKGR